MSLHIVDEMFCASNKIDSAVMRKYKNGIYVFSN